jgi:hypothetical protein
MNKTNTKRREEMKSSSLFVYLLLLGFELPCLLLLHFDRLCEKETAESKINVIAPPCPDCLCVDALRAHFSLFRLQLLVWW